MVIVVISAPRASTKTTWYLRKPPVERATDLSAMATALPPDMSHLYDQSVRMLGWAPDAVDSVKLLTVLRMSGGVDQLTAAPTTRSIMVHRLRDAELSQADMVIKVLECAISLSRKTSFSFQEPTAVPIEEKDRKILKDRRGGGQEVAIKVPKLLLDELEAVDLRGTWTLPPAALELIAMYA